LRRRSGGTIVDVVVAGENVSVFLEPLSIELLNVVVTEL